MNRVFQIGSVVLLLLTSCSRHFVPNAANVPLLQEKGELRLSLNPENLQVAVAPAKGLGLMVNYFRKNQEWEGRTPDLPWLTPGATQYQQKQHFAEGAIGYFHALGPKWTAEVYAGWGSGSTHSFATQLPLALYANQQQRFSADYNRFFVQPAIGISDRTADVAFFCRLASTGFRNIETAHYTQEQLRAEHLDKLDLQRIATAEPGVLIRAGHKYLKAEAQARFLFPTEKAIFTDRFFATLALHLNMARRYRSSKPVVHPEEQPY